MDAGSLFGVLAVFALVGANGFFVAAEFSLVKIRSTRVDQLVAEGNKTAKIVQQQVQHLDTYIAATQLGITLASLALGWVGEPSLAHLIEPLFTLFGGSTAEALSHTASVTISFILITVFHIVLGELVPKSIALQRSERTALVVAAPLRVFSYLLRPFILFMNNIGNFCVRLLGLESTSEHASVHSVEELEMLVAQSREAGILEKQEEVLLRHIFDFSDKTVQQVMVPRSEVVGIPLTTTREELVRTFTQEHYTRLPVYEGSIDNIVGMVHIKDVFLKAGNTSAPSTPETFSLRSIVRPVLYVPELNTLDTVLAQMRTRRIHLAVIIDEYGSTAGMITLEDIIEEIVGEVQDEFDTREGGVRTEIEAQPDGSFSVDGLMALPSFAEQFGVDADEAHANTVAGFIFEKLDRLPRLGDAIPFGDYMLSVEEMDGRRISRVRVERRERTEDTANQPQLTIVDHNP